MRLHHLAALCFLTLVPIAAVAESGDAAAVIRYCGPPTGEQQDVSPVTNKVQRDLFYGNVILHFQPVEDGWKFLSGWRDHLPMTQKMTEDRMPCFREAMAAAAAEQPNGPPIAVDPTIRQQTTVPGVDASTFGIPHLRIIIILIVIVAILLLLPGRRKVSRPVIEESRHRRKPAMSDTSQHASIKRVDV